MDKKRFERTRWACRRGMLELDLFLVPFFSHCYENLSAQDKQYFEDLLTLSDPELFAVVMAHQSPENKEFIGIVNKIREFKLSRRSDSLF